jgi:hypothetical protein
LTLRAPPITEPLIRLADAWRSATGASLRRAAAAGMALAWVIALLVARYGTPRARLGAAFAIGASAALAVGWRMTERRQLQRPARILRRLVRARDRGRADHALRALSLIGDDGHPRTEGTSEALAELHVARAIAQLPSDRVLESAKRIASRVGVVALVAGLCAVGITVTHAWPILEGADVLVARRGLAPVTMRWLDEIEVLARPPDYLHEGEQHPPALASLLLPYGTLLTVRGTPLHSGRRLLLSDGTTEVPFVDDGAGAAVARWPLTESANLHVVARFGDVAIAEPDALVVGSVADQPPAVTLAGAPRRVLLVEQSEDLPIQYEAVDDHGLREVHLVFRSGTREERRALVRLDGDTKRDKGGYVLKLRDSFLKKSHAPVEVTVEAKDNDPLTGPKWGTSQPLTIVPPNVGEPEARRLDALHRLRDALVDSLAWRLSIGTPGEAVPRAAFIAEENRRANADEALLTETLTQAYGGIRVPSRVRAPLTAQQRKTREAVDFEAKHPSAAAHADVVKATERFVLVTDAVLRGLGLHDSRDAARQLADVADDLAAGASQMQGEVGDARVRGVGGPLPQSLQRHMDASTLVLAGGAITLNRLGALGRDLGEIVDADLMRVKRARDGNDGPHAELAARDLAARLREPDPSFGSRGGSVARAGGESGGAPESPGDEASSADDVDQAFQQAARDVEQLAQDHAGELARMEKAMSGATSDDEREELRQEGKRHAEAIRQAVRGLPSVGNGSDSWTSKGAAARELAQQMARALEQAQSEDAVQGGRGALGALDEAKKMLQRGSWMDDPSGVERSRVDDARRKLEIEEKWAEQKLEQIGKRAMDRARQDLEEGGVEEGKLADRARDLARQGRDRESLPPHAVDAIDDAERAARQAAEALRRGEGRTGLERQREAQRHLEAANEELHGDDDATGSSPGREQGDESRASPSQGSVPLPGEHKGPEDFRRRVVRGLGQPASGALKDAVRRYAEGLLR